MNAKPTRLGATRFVYLAVVLAVIASSAAFAERAPGMLEQAPTGSTPSAGCPNASAAVRAMTQGPGWVLDVGWSYNESGHLVTPRVDHRHPGGTDDVTVQRSANYTALLEEEADVDDTYYQWYSSVNARPSGHGTVNDEWRGVYNVHNSSSTISFTNTSKGEGASLPAVQRLEFDLTRCVYSFDTSYDLEKVVHQSEGTEPTTGHLLVGVVRVKDIPIPEPKRPTDKLTLAGFARVPGTKNAQGDEFSYGDGAASGTLINIRFKQGRDLGYATVAWTFTSLFEARPPILHLDKELLERSVFLDQVPVDDQFDANVDWGDPREGFVTWQVGNTTDRVGKTIQPRVSKSVNVGAQGVGTKPVVVQAQNSVGKTSRPATTHITVAPPPACSGPPSTIQGLKLGGGDVNYKYQFKFPEPAFKAKTKEPLPDVLPFFGGKQFGIEETQVSLGVDVRATGEGYAFGSGKTGFAAMGGSLTGEVIGRADLVLNPAGVHVQGGEVEIKIAGKFKGKEPLLKLLTPLGSVVAVIERVPGAKALVNTASVQIELEPKISLVFKVKDKNGCLQWAEGEAKPGAGIKTSLIIDLIPKQFSVTVSAGGEASVVVGVPEPYYRGTEIKFTVGAKVFLYKFTLEGEKMYNARFGGKTMAQAVGEHHQAQPEADGAWQLMDRSYLTAPDYGRWTGARVTNVADQQLIPNVSPLAHPAFVVRPGAGQEILVWAQDKPGSPALSGDELMFARGTASDWSAPPKQLTNDDVSDGNPAIVALPDGNTLVVWERFDTQNPGDINADLPGFFGHMQVAAGTFLATATTPKLTPLQVSTGGTLNHRPQVGALSDGALAVWVNNARNQLLGDAANPDTLMFARYTTRDGKWTAAAPAAPNIAGLRDLKLATVGSQAALVWSQDTDGDLQTDADQELFYAVWQNGAWSAPQRLTTNSIADHTPMIKLSDAGTPLLVWQQGDTLQFLRDRWDAAPQTLPYTLDEGQAHWELQRGKDGSLALTWQELEGNDTRLGYAIYDGKAGNWSRAQTVSPPASTHSSTGASAVVSNVAPALIVGESGSPDTLAFAYQLTPITPITRTVEGVAIPNIPQAGLQQLRIAHLPLGPNLTITAADLSATPATAQPGEPVTIHATIHNTGGRSIAGGTAELLSRHATSNAGGTVIATQPFGILPAGGVAPVTFTIPRPATAEQKFVVRVEPPANVIETIFGDNEATLGTELAASALTTEYVPGGVVPQVTIERQGALPYGGSITATLRLDDPNGPVVGQEQLHFLNTPTGPVTVTGWIPSSLLTPGRHLIYWNIDPGERLGERNRADNVPVTAVRVQPDLATEPLLISWDQTPGPTTPIHMVVRNEGNATAQGGSVAMWDGEPGQEGSHLLGRLALPTLAAGESAEVNGTLDLANLPAATTGLQGMYVQLDPANTLDELNENNNVLVVGGVLGGPVVPPPTTTYKVYLPLVQR